MGINKTAVWTKPSMTPDRYSGMKLHTGSVASTPTVWVEAPGVDAAGITFRVGLADEPLTHRGITGLTMTLLVDALKTAGIESRFQIGTQRTTLRSLGDPVLFFDTLGDWLAQPDFTDLDSSLDTAQRKLLALTPIGEHFRTRFGNVGPGRQNLPKLGLSWIGSTQVETWLARYFNDANSCPWFVGPSAPMTAARLPKGTRAPVVPIVRKGPWSTPQWVPTTDDDDNRVSFSMILADKPETVVIRNVLEATVSRSLDDAGISHLEPIVSFDSVGDDLGQLHLSVETARDSLNDALGELRNMLSNLALGGCRQIDLDLAVEESMRRDNQPSGHIAYATRAAFNRLCDRPTPVPIMRSAVYSAVTPAVLADYLEAAWTSIVWTSASVELSPDDAEIPTMVGVLFEGVNGSDQITLSEAGIRYDHGDRVTSVGWRDIEAVVHTGESERCLYTKDGPPLELSSDDWTEGTNLIGDIDRYLPRSRHIPTT